MDEEQAAWVVAVLQSMSSIEQEQSTKSGHPDAPGKTFDELFEWNVDDEGAPFHNKVPETFDDYLYAVLLGSDRSQGCNWVPRP